ncbi:MBL fold metallo-hydrolase [Pseudalkalibacillus caeni]|uniref:MBL fold metallo-hydrolase n=1 Tax=Exobacillus caeni TaxID=2574798 RepID=A0A5R9EZ01_9BACL|nr:MBL fold metallo-hydrolase [Pseudalkalibacillus caeni]TLS36417.1 MBL fold metallo-hydrolase [Pseudalkalibacillus caeni]
MKNTSERTKHIIPLTVPTPFAVGPVNCYLLVGDSVTLVDAGAKTKEAKESIARQIKEAGLSIDNIDQILLTHHHPDHVGLINTLSNEKTQLIGHWKNQPWINKDEAFLQHHETFFLDLYKQSGVDPVFFKHTKDVRSYLAFAEENSLDMIVKEGDVLPGNEGWKIIETPGHAESHISLYHEKEKTMIAGDHLIKHISSNPLIEAPYPGESNREKPLLQQRDSWKRSLELDLSIVYTGHGDPIFNTEALIHSRLKSQEERSFIVYEMINERPMTAFEVCQKLFPKVYEKQFGLTLSETIGHLDYLLSIDRIKAVTRGKVTYFQSV